MSYTELINFDQEKFNRFCGEYEKHKDYSDAVFKFEGHDYLVGYAKYLIEYLGQVFEVPA